MAKRGFRDERKRILSPTLSQGEGECSDGKNNETSLFTHTPLSRGAYPAIAGYLQKGKLWRVTYSVSPKIPEGGQAGKGDKPPPLHILRFCGAHIQLLLATFKKGNCGDSFIR